MSWILCKELKEYGEIDSDLSSVKVFESSNKKIWRPLSTQSKFFLRLIASMHLASKAVLTAASSSVFTAFFSCKNLV